VACRSFEVDFEKTTGIILKGASLESNTRRRSQRKIYRIKENPL